MTHDTTLTLPTLLEALLAAKAEEKRINDQRKQIEAAILLLLPTKEEGTVTQEVGSQKLSVAYKINRTVSATVMQDWANLTEAAQKAFRFKPELDLKSYRALQELAPDAYIEASAYVTAKPASPYLSVEAA